MGTIIQADKAIGAQSISDIHRTSDFLSLHIMATQPHHAWLRGERKTTVERVAATGKELARYVGGVEGAIGVEVGSGAQRRSELC